MLVLRLADKTGAPFPCRNRHVNRAPPHGYANPRAGRAVHKARLMARSFPTTVLLAFAALLAVAPANAQFGSIFSDPPPRPPASVPRGGTQPMIFPGRDEPPVEPQPPPMNLPPASRPGARGIQSQPLPPPPGGAAAPAETRPGTQQASPGQVLPGQALPGLPPGVRQPRGSPQPVNTAPQPGDEVVVQPPEQKIVNPTAVFSGLDKITGRIISFDVAINETVQFGALQVTPRVCYSRPPTETPNTDAFLAVDEVTLQGEVRRIFTGWMFAASPGLHAVEHPIYDVWLTECKGATPAVTAEAPAEKPPTPKPPAPRKRSPAQPPSFLPLFR